MKPKICDDNKIRVIYLRNRISAFSYIADVFFTINLSNLEFCGGNMKCLAVEEHKFAARERPHLYNSISSSLFEG